MFPSTFSQLYTPATRARHSQDQYRGSRINIAVATLSDYILGCFGQQADGCSAIANGLNLIAGQFPSYILFFINQDYDQRRDKNNLHTDKPLKYSHPTVSLTVLI
ncbi:hypothetical protein [Citrobacter freundii]|uniref:hypothetical protein n=1 Tax=Citrobacter freundii TaxID=546 RepID=UPI0019D2DFDD